MPVLVLWHMFNTLANIFKDPEHTQGDYDFTELYTVRVMQSNIPPNTGKRHFATREVCLKLAPCFSQYGHKLRGKTLQTDTTQVYFCHYRGKPLWLNDSQNNEIVTCGDSFRMVRVRVSVWNAVESLCGREQGGRFFSRGTRNPDC